MFSTSQSCLRIYPLARTTFKSFFADMRTTGLPGWWRERRTRLPRAGTPVILIHPSPVTRGPNRQVTKIPPPPRPSSSRPNRDPSPHTQASVYHTPPPFGSGVGTLAWRRGGGGFPIPTRGQIMGYTRYKCTLWQRPTVPERNYLCLISWWKLDGEGREEYVRECESVELKK
jgi:hypothetical protein